MAPLLFFFSPVASGLWYLQGYSLNLQFIYCCDSVRFAVVLQVSVSAGADLKNCTLNCFLNISRPRNWPSVLPSKTDTSSSIPYFGYSIYGFWHLVWKLLRLALILLFFFYVLRSSCCFRLGYIVFLFYSKADLEGLRLSNSYGIGNHNIGNLPLR